LTARANDGALRRVKYGLMQIDITIEDPKAYTKPFTVRVNQSLMRIPN